MSDLISRKALIDTVENTSWYHINEQGNLVLGAHADEEPLYKTVDIYSALVFAPTVDAVELPCKLGDTVYQTDGIRVYESTIGEITLTARHSIFVTENIAFDEHAIGETIYLTREEAEAAINKKEKENEVN